MSENDILKSNGITGSHAMIITGINIIDNKPTKWKIENSWGDKGDKKGYWVATNEWIDRYIYRVIINKKYLTKAEKELLKQDPIIVSKLESRF